MKKPISEPDSGRGYTTPSSAESLPKQEGQEQKAKKVNTDKY